MMMQLVYSAIIGASLAGFALLAQGGAETAPAPFSEARADQRAYSPVGLLESAPSLSASQIDDILASYGSPATGEGAAFYDLGVTWRIDPAYALAFFVEESSAGTNPSWNGLKPDGSTTHDIGNITCGGGFACYGRWRDYPDWKTGIDDWYRLIRVEYIEQRGLTTVDEVIPIYAPAFENDVGGYTNTVNALVGKWRTQQEAPSLSAQAVGAPYLLQGDTGVNVTAALNANGGALMGFTIGPGETWSFGHSIAPISALGHLPVVCGPAGCNAGGGWCDLSALYVKVADQLGLVSSFPAHAGVSDPRFPGILLDENGNGGDLQITNTTGVTAVFRARVEGDSLIVEGGSS